MTAPRNTLNNTSLNASDARSFSVIMPTRNRAAVLEQTLQALANQTVPPLEVIVINDGSEDETPGILEAWSKRENLPFIFMTESQDSKGPAAARNRGVELASGSYVAFLGDDTLPEANWLEIHARCHEQVGPGHAIVGYTMWDPDFVRTTPYLQYINHQGPQFAYAKLISGETAPFFAFYTSNVSLSRHWLAHDRFHESFELAMWEDTELGYRLCNRGMKIIYQAGARTRHRHKVDMGSFLTRMCKAGKAVPKLALLHNDLGRTYGFEGHLSAWLLSKTNFLWRGLFPLCGWLDRNHIRLPFICYKLITAAAYFNGLTQARRQAKAGSTLKR